MKILHTVEFYHPSVGGAQEVVRQVSERLAARGHDVTVATSRLSSRTQSTVSGLKIAEFDVSGNAVQGLQGDVRGYQTFLLGGDFDVMLNYAAQQWTTDAALPILDQLPYARVLAPCGFSGLFDPAYGGYFDSMPDVMRRYDRTLLHSSRYRDAQFATGHGVANTVIVPNGAGLGEFNRPHPGFRDRHRIPGGAPLILTVGTHTGLKGHETVMEAFRKARTGRAVLVIVGNSLPGGGCRDACGRAARKVGWLTLGKKRVLLLDPPRHEVLAAYEAADLFVLASKIECFPLVLVEAMASGTPFITSRCGNGEELSMTGAGVLADGYQDTQGLTQTDVVSLARDMEALLADASRRQHMATTGRTRWLEQYTWEGIAQQYETLYADAVAARSPHPPGKISA